MGDELFVNSETIREVIARDIGKAYPGITQVKKAMDDFASLTYENQAMHIVYDFVRLHLDPSDEKYATFSLDEVYVVHFTYILGNWRAMVGTSLPNGMYYEVVYAKHHGSARLNAYERSDHQEFFVDEVLGPDLEKWAKDTVMVYLVDGQGYPVNRSTLKIRIISYAYIIGYWKALIDTNFDNVTIYEVTFDPRKRTAYLDPYKLFPSMSKEIAISSKETSSG